jgi:hypothetical protein
MIVDVLILVVYLGILYGAVRPSSPAAGAVKTVSSGLIALVGTVTGFDTSPIQAGSSNSNGAVSA